jgi:hypothetical protein
MHKTPDQRDSHELRERLARQQADEWAEILRSDAGKRATEAWAQEHPTITAQSAPRFIIGMAFGAYVKRHIRKLRPEGESK